MRTLSSSSSNGTTTLLPLFLLAVAVTMMVTNCPAASAAQFELHINKWYYLMLTEWGTPRQSLNLALDMGSQDLWVYGGMCWVISDTCKLGTNDYYRKANSTSFQTRSGSYSIAYAYTTQFNGSIHLNAGTEQMSAVGSASSSTALTATQSTVDFAYVDKADWSMYKRVNMSGIFGIGRQSHLTTTNYLQKTLAGSTSASPPNITLFTNTNTSTAVLTVNAKDTTNCAANWTWIVSMAPDPSFKYWEVPLSSLNFGSYSTGTLNGHTAIFSTLTSYMRVPNNVYGSILSIVKEEEWDYAYDHYLVNCGDRWRFPTFKLTIGGNSFNVSPYEYIWMTPSLFCILKIEPNGGSSRWVLGYPFHRGHCEHFNYATSTIGLTTSIMH